MDINLKAVGYLGILNKIESGLIYFNDFDTINLDQRLMVSILDSSRYSVGNGWFTLHHGAEPIKVFLKIDEPNYVAIMKNDYVPVSAGDEGGLIVFQDDEYKIELLEYFNSDEGTTITYPYLKIDKNGYNYYAYWSDDEKTWHLFGSTALIFAGENLGFVLYGESGVDLKVDFLKVYKSNFVKLLGLVKGTKIELYDNDGKLQVSTVVDNSEFYIQAPYYPFKGYFRFYSLDGQTYEQSEVVELWGGDVYIRESVLDIYYNNEIIYSSTEIELGTLQNVIETNFEIVNNTNQTFTNVVVQVVQVDDNDGYKLALVALDSSNLEYRDTIIIPQIAPSERYKIWVKISKQEVVKIPEGIGMFQVVISSD